MKLSSEWYRHLPESEQKEFEELIKSNHRVLGRLLELLDEKVGSLDKWEDSPASYDSGYPFQQAYVNGKRSGLKEVRRLLEFLDQRKLK